MQHPELPDLAHTRTRPVHWAATAAAMAAVVALAGLLQPDDATANASAARPGPGAPAPDPADLVLPLDCGTASVMITRKATGDLDGDGGAETVVAARCAAGSGTSPEGIYVLARTREGGSRVVATLVAPGERQSLAALTVREGKIAATLLGYSSPEIPSCCPDRREDVSWRWQGGKFLRAPESTGEKSGTAVL
ncbi:hypothetical protein [Streptomyces qinzhouensis]|uniref:Secreted protein n=1 Tax=Streptomyces qinzhouensis TaxID=2599401 RepID=A0A5B8J7W7_9ACTN|nr:hypothetical protein [Streptomyces qinzhouensis]QDY75991.1 hypothetical protein FQU76_05010 [Streptomyces qinzhouensis]